MSSVDTVVFDLGNVVFCWNPRHLYRKVFDDETEMETFLHTVCTMAWHLAHDRGTSFRDNAAALKKEFPEHGPLIDMWGERFQEMIPGRLPGTREIMESLKAGGVTLHGITNMPAEVYPVLRERFPELQLLEVTVVSGDEGVIKPHRRIFDILAERTGLVPARTLFVDDSRLNIDAAEELGFRTHHFTGAAGLADHLEALGLAKGKT
ncbi:HAD superfamily hydrolase (TIGR01509 family) [Parvibaculum indicum]|uniref:HAD family hydrolase n=1 Tax=Parvibaculum indicum TaxID=562969 RepID=UPI001423488B|nr:HAD family phosphatase [Parvibaculum indicum]NIJ40539.1 HAD superfamily hydrolase (TIGR01509 family) [Parvibaculum indicum]